MLDDTTRAIVDRAVAADAPLVWLTGAGISAESGIPTFRGEEGYWRVGSRHYRAQEMATRAAFDAMPDEVWSWYLYRRSVCRQAAPNPAHLALAELEQTVGERFRLVTQNVDGLHLRAGNDVDRTWQIHGNIDYMRPVGGGPRIPIPLAIGDDWGKGRTLTDDERALLTHDGEPCRPHVLWFDETYDEENYRFESALEAALEMSLLVVVGTTGQTSLPHHMGLVAQKRRVPMLVINPEANPFVDMMRTSGAGVFLEGTAGEWVPQVAEAIAGAFARG
jgi:NAD-dependent deacetylase